MSDLQMPKIKELKIFKVFVSMATKLSNRQRFYKNTVIQSKLHISYFCKEKYELCMHIIVLESPHLLNKYKQ